MECIEAQALISDVLDRNPVDASSLEAAKAHCRHCSTCEEFVRALNIVRRAPLPQPRADLTDRVMTAVRAEAASEKQAEAARIERAGAAAAETATPHDAHAVLGAVAETEEGTTATERALAAAAAAVAAREQADAKSAASSLSQSVAQRLSFDGGPRSKRQLIAWGSAAAALILLVTVSASLGVMRLLGGKTGSDQPSQSTTLASPSGEAPKATADVVSPQDSGAAGSAGGAATESGAASSAQASPNLYIVFDGSVYRHTGLGDQSLSEVKSSGTARVSFDATTPPTTRSVYSGSTSGLVYIADNQKQLQRFELVTRGYKSTTYVLKSADITTFDGWPTLPAGVPTPTSADGSPTFALDSTDPSGVSVYHRVGADAHLGIAVPPGTSVSDPAAGNPNWTWWVPAP